MSIPKNAVTNYETAGYDGHPSRVSRGYSLHRLQQNDR